MQDRFARRVYPESVDGTAEWAQPHFYLDALQFLLLRVMIACDIRLSTTETCFRSFERQRPIGFVVYLRCFLQFMRQAVNRFLKSVFLSGNCPFRDCTVRNCLASKRQRHTKHRPPKQ